MSQMDAELVNEIIAYQIQPIYAAIFIYLFIWDFDHEGVISTENPALTDVPMVEILIYPNFENEEITFESLY